MGLKIMSSNKKHRFGFLVGKSYRNGLSENFLSRGQKTHRGGDPWILGSSFMQHIGSIVIKEQGTDQYLDLLFKNPDPTGSIPTFESLA